MTPEEQKEEAKTDLMLEESDMRELMSKPAGRRVFFAWLERCGVMASAFDSNPHTMAFLEGRRSMGVEMLQRLQEMTPKEYLEMMVEAAKAAAEKALKAQAKPR